MKVRSLKVCTTCRKRKLGCDGNVPACSQCLHSGQQCPGYQQDLIFKPVERVTKKRARPRAERKSKTVSLSLPKGGNDDAPSTKHANPAQPSRSLSWPLLDIIGFVVRSFSPVQEISSSPINSYSSPSRICGSWIEVLPHLPWSEKAEDVLAPAIRTLALSMLAQEPHHLIPVSEALEARVEALRSLRSGLRQCDGNSSNAFLASIMCLLLAEILLPTLGSGAMIHVKGVQDFMQLYTPNAYVSGMSHQLFVGFRPILIVHSVFTRECSFLANEEWRIVPFSVDPMNPLQSLLTEASFLPATLSFTSNVLQQPHPNSEMLARESIAKLVDVLNHLMQWRASHQSSTSGYRLIAKDQSANRLGVWFPDITSANVISHYWTMWIMCIGHIRRLQVKFPELDITPFEVDGQRLYVHLQQERVARICDLLLQIVEFLMQDEFRLFGLASTTLCCRAAYEVLQDLGELGVSQLVRNRRTIEDFNRKTYCYFLRSIWN
ncbi:hypothetical protein ACMFMG_006171 [Clarireedia jacksonii]